MVYQDKQSGFSRRGKESALEQCLGFVRQHRAALDIVGVAVLFLLLLILLFSGGEKVPTNQDMRLAFNGELAPIKLWREFATLDYSGDAKVTLSVTLRRDEPSLVHGICVPVLPKIVDREGKSMAREMNVLWMTKDGVSLYQIGEPVPSSLVAKGQNVICLGDKNTELVADRFSTLNVGYSITNTVEQLKDGRRAVRWFASPLQGVSVAKAEAIVSLPDGVSADKIDSAEAYTVASVVPVSMDSPPSSLKDIRTSKVPKGAVTISKNDKGNTVVMVNSPTPLLKGDSLILDIVWRQ